jgi:hypothetical protein
MDTWDMLELITDSMPEGSRKRALEVVMNDVLRLQKVAQKARLLAIASLDESNVMDLQWAKDIIDLTPGLPDRTPGNRLPRKASEPCMNCGGRMDNLSGQFIVRRGNDEKIICHVCRPVLLADGWAVVATAKGAS